MGGSLGPAGGWGVGGDCKSARRGGKHAWGAWGILRHPIFSVLESTKGLVEDKPWKRAQGVRTEHPSATIEQRDWGCTQWAVGLLYNREITTLNVRTIKPNCLSSPLQHKALSLGLTDLPPPRWAAWYRSPPSRGLGVLCALTWGRPGSVLPAVFKFYTEGGNRQNRLHLGPDCGLWALCPVSMETTHQPENQRPLPMEEPQGSYLDSPSPKRIP